MESGMAELAVGAAAVWRVTHLVHAEGGPWNVLSRLRELAGAGVWGRILGCFYCSSVWIAVPFAAGLDSNWTARLLLWPALSGAAILLERATSSSQRNSPLAEWYVESTGEVTEGRKS